MESPSSILDAMFPGEWSTEQNELFHAIVRCHHDASLANENVSSVAVKMAKIGGADPRNQIMAGLSTIGYRHAPVCDARLILFDGEPDAWKTLVESGNYIPGFGNEFFKDKIDPSFSPAFDLLPADIQSRLNEIAEQISKAHGGASIFPNAASITAAVAHHLQLPLGAEVLIFLIGRGAGWITL